MLQPVFESVDTVGRDEFFEWVEGRAAVGDVHRYELLNGRIVMTPPAGWPHGETESRLGTRLRNHVEQRNLGRVFGSSQGFELPSGDTVAADHSYVSVARWEATPPREPGRLLRVVPDLVVEILSPKTTSRDRGEKKAIYERNGVVEYWILDTRARSITRFVLGDGVFDAGTAFGESETFASVVLPDLRFPVADVFPR